MTVFPSQDDACPNRTITCPFGCGAVVLMHDMQEHRELHCPLVLEECQVCGVRLPRKDREEHELQSCHKRVVACALGCGEEMLEREHAVHLNHRCALRMVPCEPVFKMISNFKNYE